MLSWILFDLLRGLVVQRVGLLFTRVCTGDRPVAPTNIMTEPQNNQTIEAEKKLVKLMFAAAVSGIVLSVILSIVL